jgi:predicted amidohydrolase YtcJ
VVRDASGHPSGLLLESAMEIAERAVNREIPTEQKLSLLHQASLYLNRFGITSVVNATGSLAEIELYAALRDRGELTVRTRTAFGAVAYNHHLTDVFLHDLEEARTRYHDRWVAANLVKFFADGGTGAVPPLTYVPADYRKLVLELDRRGYQLMTHALRGDSAHLVLDAYDAAATANGPRDRRLRLEHADVLFPGDLPRFAASSIIASMQPAVCCSEIGTNYDPREKSPSDRWQSLEKSGAIVAFGSDWPCTWPPDPFVGIATAVNRLVWKPASGTNFPAGQFDGAAQAGSVATSTVYSAEERLTVPQAVNAYTRESAFANFADQYSGTLEPGKQADLVVLSQDIFSVAPEKIAATHAVLTMVDGNVVFKLEE